MSDHHIKSVAYILDCFPKISETFILNEILSVQNKGIDVTVYAFGKPGERELHGDVSLVKNVVYFQAPNFWQVLLAHVHWLLKSPHRYWRTIKTVLSKGSRLNGFFYRYIDFVRLICGDRPDHIHAHFASGATDVAMLVRLLADIPFTFTTHRYDIFDNPPGNYPLKTSLAKKHITISQYNSRYLIHRFSLLDKDIEVIHCGVNMNAVRSVKVKREDNCIVTVARLAKEKSLDDLVWALSLLDQKGCDFKSFIIGDGPLRDELAGLIRSLNLQDKVELVGNKPQQDVFRWIASATVMVLPSRSEGIPVSLMEAMALQTPVIATKITGIPELIVDNESGVLVEPGDVQSLSRVMEKLLNDRECRERIGRNGYEKVMREFNLEIEVDKLIRVWFPRVSQDQAS